VPHDATDLLAVLREGSVYLGLLRRIHAGPHHCAYPDCAHATPPTSLQWDELEGAAGSCAEGGWLAVVRAFLHGEHALSVLGGSCRTLEILCSVEASSKPLHHLALLTSLRVLLEMDQPSKWTRFVASLSGPSLSDARRPRFTPRDPRDDYSYVEDGAEVQTLIAIEYPQ
jgi:hypothetical protein